VRQRSARLYRTIPARARIVAPDDTSRHATRIGRAAEGQRWVQFLRAGHFKDPT